MRIKRRAITDEQKEARRGALLETAWNLFQQKPYEEITVAEVAAAAGLAKGTIYLYFETKEELFLAIQEQQFGDWFTLVGQRLEGMIGHADIRSVVEMICGSLDERPAMVRLFAILHTVIEQNVRYEAVYRFKRNLHDQIAAASVLLERCLPLQPGQGNRFFMWAYALILGLQQVSDQAPVVRSVIENEPGMNLFNLDFCEACTEAAAALLTGMIATQGE